MGRQRGGIVAQRGARSVSLTRERTIRHARAGMVRMRREAAPQFTRRRMSPR